MNRRTDGRTDIMKIIIALCNFAKALKIGTFILYGLFRVRSFGGVTTTNMIE
jgi:hypothetical protein